MAVQNAPLGSFIWGQNGARLTPDQIATLRAIEARRQMQGVDTSPVDHWSQGAARVVDALGNVLRERRTNAADAQNQAEDAATAGPLTQYLSGMLSGGNPTASPSPVPMSGAGAEVSASSPAPQTASIPQTADAEYVRNGLLARGFSPQVSDGFIANFQDESGLNSGLNERAPIVPGSRGGYGLYQLTGPRRVAYESFAKERGVDPSNVDAQLDFLKYETQGPEAAAAKTFLNAPDTATAAQNIVNNFLRPAPEHRQARAAAYAGLPSVQTAPVAPVEVASLAAPQTATDAIAAASPTQTPYVDPQVTTAYQAPPPPMTAPQNVQQQPVRGNRLGQPTAISQGQFDERFGAPQQFDAGSPDMVAASLMGNPTPQVSPQAIAAQVAPQPVQQAAQTPQYPQAPQVQTVPPQVLAQAIQASQSPYASERTKTVANAIIQQQQAAQAAQQKQNQFVFEQQYQQAAHANDPLRQAQILKAQQDVAAGADRTPESVRALQQRAELSGLQQGTPEYNNFIQTGGNVQRTEAAPPVGYRYVRDPSGAISNLELIPGSPQAMEAEKAALKQSTTNELKDVAANTVVSSIGKAINAIQAPGLPATGTFGNMLSGVPESNAAELRRQLASIKSNITLDSLQAARAASPTGAALGAVSDKEGELLANKLGALDPSSPNFQRDILDVQKTYLQTVYGKEKGDTLFDQSVTLRNANAAIAKGANREAVLKKLQDAGIPTEGLQ